MATAIPKPTPSVVISRPRPALFESAELDFVSRKSRSPPLKFRQKTKNHHSRASCLRKGKLPGGTTPLNSVRFFDWLAAALVFYFWCGRTRVTMRR
jgi:hypothetical protein